MDKERKKGIQIHRSIVYGSHARLLTPEEKATGVQDPSHTHRWTVFLTSAPTPPPQTTASIVAKGRGKGKSSLVAGTEAEGEVIPEDINFITGGADDLSWLIKRVAFKLHETYANFNRNIDKPPFRVTETGWGEFSIAIRVQFQPETSEKTLTLSHNLKLHHWGPVAVMGAGAGGATAGGGEGGAGEGVSGMNGQGGTGRDEGAETVPVTEANTPAAEPSSANGGANPAPPSDSTPTPAAEADESALTAIPDDEDGDEDVKMEDGAAKGVESAAGGTREEDDDADADAEGEDDDDADGEADDADGPILAPQVGGNNEMDVDPSANHNDTDTKPHAYINPLPVHSWQYDEIVFSDPTPQFYDLLLANEPTKLPVRSRRKPGDEGAGALIDQDRGSAGVPLEFTSELERAEANKLDEARRKVVEETDKWRQRIIDLEKEQIALKEQVAGY